MRYDPSLWEECGPDRCGNCHNLLEPGDRYCRLCGTKVGEGAYAPFLNLMQCIYGPAPVNRTHTCPTCRYTWETFLMIDDEKYCPKCGGSGLNTIEDEIIHELEIE